MRIKKAADTYGTVEMTPQNIGEVLIIESFINLIEKSDVSIEELDYAFDEMLDKDYLTQ